jgi:hypothetical protein
MQPNQPTTCAPQSPLAIPELAKNILSRLPDTRDLLHFRATTKVLKAIIDETLSIQRLLWKRPTPVKHGTNPHFPSLTTIQVEYHVEPSKMAVMESLHRIHWAFYAAIEAGEDVASADMLRKQQSEHLWTRDIEPMTRVTSMLDFTREPIVQAFECENCLRLHAPFISSGLHHALGFLYKHDMCGRGWGSELLFHFSLGCNLYSEPLLQPGLDESSEHSYHRTILYRIAALTRVVSHAYEGANQYGLLGDYFTAPVCTRLIMTQSSHLYVVETSRFMETERSVIRDEDGIKLGQMLLALLHLCRRTFSHRRTEVLATQDADIIELYDEALVEFPVLAMGSSREMLWDY